MREHMFEGGGPALNYAEGPHAGPPLVLLHGGAWRWQEFLPLVPALSTRRHLFAVDLRGHGGSERAPGRYRLRDFADDAARFLEHRVGRPAALLGHSMGGVAALMVAARHPEAVSALILEDISLDLDLYRQYVASAHDLYGSWRDLAASGRSPWEMLGALSDLLVRLPGGGPPVRLAEAPGATPDWLMFMAACLVHLDPVFFETLLGDFDAFAEGFDPEPMLASVPCPVLVLRGERERGAVLTDAELDRAVALHPRLLVARIEGVGHELHMGHAEPVQRAIANFLEMS